MIRKLVLVLFLFFFAPAAVFAQEDKEADIKHVTGLALPRFASLRSGEINLRTGPGTRYPIEWVLKRQGVPVEITAEYDIWRRIRDWDGTEGWVHKVALTGKRTAVVTGKRRDLKKEDAADSLVVAHLDVGAVGDVLSCSKDWCRIKFDGIKGYLQKNEFWGAYPEEVFD